MVFKRLPTRPLAMAALALAAGAAAAGGATPPAPPGLTPKTVVQRLYRLPLAGSSEVGDYNLILVADRGHDAATSAAHLCEGVGRTFNASAYVAPGAAAGGGSRCEADVAAAQRAARGLALQHDETYSEAVAALEGALAGAGHKAADFDGPTVWSKPYRAALLRRIAAGLAAGGAPPTTVCEVGFGAGHSALLWLALSRRPTAGGGGAAPTPPPAPDAPPPPPLGLPRPVTVHAFDHGLAKHTLPAHDLLDAGYPGGLLLYLGDSFVSVPQMGDYYPGGAPCEVVYVDGSKTAESVAADLAQLAPPRSARGAVVLLAGAPAGSEARAAWEAAAAGGGPILAWEATAEEAPGAPGTDATLVGRYL